MDGEADSRIPPKTFILQGYKYEGSITYNSKLMANIKVSCSKQTEKQTGQKLYAHDLWIRRQKTTFSGNQIKLELSQSATYPQTAPCYRTGIIL